MTSRADHEKDPAYGLKLRLGSGRRLKLGERLGRGGEGSVYAAANRRNHAVKLYKAPDKPQLATKIAAMVDAGLARQSPFAAFPVDVVRTQDGAFAGFLMKAVRDRRPLHDLYAPGARKQHFPDIDYRFLARTATNIARAVASIHHTGCVIGDINPSGMLVADDATVALVDADSFQFSHGGQQFLCAVGVPDYTPPELQGQSFHGVVRTQQHDAFGLAVILFQVLMMGRHPFDGVPDTGEALPMGERIQRRLYPHIPERPTGM
ncbi:MAG: topoisomerase, partial [Lautropia mirabilis]|nr:topoisomerase [Lautropia mirabilis]